MQAGIARKFIILPIGAVAILLLLFFGTTLYLSASARSAIEAGRYADAERYLTWSVRLMPWSGEQNAWLGDVLQDQQKWDAALAQYTLAIQKGFTPGFLWTNKGYIYNAKATLAGIQNNPTAQREYAVRAVADFKKAVEKDPHSAVDYFFLGTVYFFELEDYVQALQFYRKALELEPGNAHRWTAVAVGYTGIGQYHRALEHLERSLRIELTPQAYNNIGWIYGFRLNDYTGALEALGQAITLDPNYALAYQNLGGIYVGLGETEKALEAYHTYLRLEPEGRWAEFVRSEIQKLQAL